MITVILEVKTRYKFSEFKPQPRWKLDQADWSLFRQRLYSVNICIDDKSSVNEKNTEFVDSLLERKYKVNIASSSLLEICNETIPKTKQTKSRKKVVPWWTNEYHLLDYRNKRDISKRTLLRVKKENWEPFCSQLTYINRFYLGDIWNELKFLKKSEYNLILTHFKYLQDKICWSLLSGSEM